MTEKVGLPTGSSMKGALEAGAVGAIGGALVQASRKFLGTGLVGSVAGVVVAGSMLKDGKGEIIATVLGERAGEELLGGFLGGNAGGSTQQSGGGSAFVAM